MAELAEVLGTENPSSVRAEKIITVYLDTVRWFIRPRNTDWRYTRFVLPRLTQFEPRLRVHPQSSVGHALRHNGEFLASWVARRAGLKKGNRSTFLGALDENELKNAGCDVVFSHSGFPVNASQYPVVWQNSILDPEMQRARGATDSDLQYEAEAKGRLFARAAAVQVSTESEVVRLERMFPELTGRFHSVPFYLPDVEALSEVQVLAKHHRPAKLNLLFVGNEARRKGLPLLFEAYSLLPSSLRERVCFDVVTNFADGPVDVPRDSSIRMRGSLPHATVLELMAKSHVVAMPSKFESYGLIFPEAMSKGSVAIVPDWEVQREIVDGGSAGCIANTNASDLSMILSRLIEDEPFRTSLGLAARRRFVNRFSPAVVASAYRRVFEAAKQ